MAKSEENDCIGTAIPQDAVEIVVTHIVNLYFIRINQILDNTEKKNNLRKMLEREMKSYLKKNPNKHYTPKIGDDVIISANHMNNIKIDLPDWICRGIVTDTAPKTTDLFLLDYGIVINVPTESLIKYSRNYVPIEALTLTVGIYNILPIDSNFCVLKEWPKSSIDFVKDLIQTSKKVFFKVLAYDKNINKIYGDLFLVIEDKNICLSKVLIRSHLAVALCNEIQTAIKNSNGTNKILVPFELEQKKSVINSNIFLHANESLINYKRININSKIKHSTEKILIRSKFPCQLLENVADARFTNLVHKALKNHGVRTLKRIQSYMWPAIKQGLDVTAISSIASGKTIGYTVPILSSIAAQEEAIVEKQKNSIITKPVALILCASVNKCINIAARCKEILYYNENIKTFAAFNGLSDKYLMTNIYNKFHVLVSTPPFLLRLLKKYSNKLNLSELSYVSLDQADELLAKYLPDLMSLIRDYKIINKDNKNCIQGGPMQIIVVARSWTDKIRSFVDIFMEDPYICIGSFTEAAAFCRVQGRMLIRHSDKKPNEILEILEDYSKVKTMIFCVNSEEAIKLNNFLTLNCVKTLLIHEEMSMTEIQELKEDWMRYLPGMYPVIICTDQVLSEIEISNIEFLIHYSITSTSKTQFTRRFSVLMDNWLLELKTKCKVLIFFDETKESVHFKGVINILKRLNVELPSDWKEIAEGLDLANDIKKKNYPLCDFIKLFGTCEVSSCPYRHHIIAEVDSPTTNITIGDELKLHVTYVHSASHISARILEYTTKCNLTGNKKSVTFPYDILSFNIKVKQYFSESKNRRMPKEICIGNIYALRNLENNFSRVQILNILEKDIKSDKPKIIRARCIDDGQMFERVYVYKLYEIPDDYLEYKFPIVDIYLTNIAPFDEYKWTDIANKDVINWIKNECSSSSFVFAKVLLHIGYSIWTDSLTIRTKLIGYPDLVSASLTNILKKQEHGTENKKHLSNLLHLCHLGGLTEINGCQISLLPSDEKNDSINECD